MTKTKTTEDLLKDYQQLLQFTQNALTKVSLELKRVKVAVSQLANFDPNDPNSLDPSSLGLGEAEANELREAYTDEEMADTDKIERYLIFAEQARKTERSKVIAFFVILFISYLVLFIMLISIISRF